MLPISYIGLAAPAPVFFFACRPGGSRCSSLHSRLWALLVPLKSRLRGLLFEIMPRGHICHILTISHNLLCPAICDILVNTQSSGTLRLVYILAALRALTRACTAVIKKTLHIAQQHTRERFTQLRGATRETMAAKAKLLHKFNANCQTSTNTGYHHAVSTLATHLKNRHIGRNNNRNTVILGVQAQEECNYLPPNAA